MHSLFLWPLDSFTDFIMPVSSSKLDYSLFSTVWMCLSAKVSGFASSWGLDFLKRLAALCLAVSFFLLTFDELVWPGTSFKEGVSRIDG